MFVVIHVHQIISNKIENAFHNVIIVIILMVHNAQYIVKVIDINYNKLIANKQRSVLINVNQMMELNLYKLLINNIIVYNKFVLVQQLQYIQVKYSVILNLYKHQLIIVQVVNLLVFKVHHVSQNVIQTYIIMIQSNAQHHNKVVICIS